MNLIEHLIEAGFVNLLEYPGGIKQWKLREKDTLQDTCFFDDKDGGDNDGHEDDIRGAHDVDDNNDGLRSVCCRRVCRRSVCRRCPSTVCE